MTLRADLRRWALFAVWEDDAALDAFLGEIARALRAGAAARRTRSASRRCARTAHGAAPTRRAGAGDRTSAGRSPSSPARRSGRRSSSRSTGRSRHPPRDLAGGPGLLAAVGVGEWPVARQATFSLWRNLADAHGLRLRAAAIAT